MIGQPDQTTLPPTLPKFSTPVPRLPRVWPSALLLGIFWTLYSICRWTEFGMSLGFTGFIAVYGAGALTTLLFAIWWLAASRVRWSERLAVFAAVIFVGVAVALCVDSSALGLMFMPGLPIVLTAWIIGLLLIRHWRPRRRGLAL